MRTAGACIDCYDETSKSWQLATVVDVPATLPHIRVLFADGRYHPIEIKKDFIDRPWTRSLVRTETENKSETKAKPKKRHVLDLFGAFMLLFFLFLFVSFPAPLPIFQTTSMSRTKMCGESPK